MSLRTQAETVFASGQEPAKAQVRALWQAFDAALAASGEVAATDVTQAPAFVGQFGVAGGEGYIAVGTQVADWKRITAPATPPVTVWQWADVFTDHSAAGGQDWTGWGATANQPAEVPLEWFLRNVVTAQAPAGSRINLSSPTGTMHLTGRMQPPPTSLARNMTVDLGGTVVERGYGGNRWGQFFIWGEKVQSGAVSDEGVIGADSSAGDTVLHLRDPDPDTDALLAAAVYGSIIEIRTNTTAPNYHPPESRATCFVSSVDTTAKTITVLDPLPINVPQYNSVNSWDGATDPSTVTLLQGGLLTANAQGGDTTIRIGTAVGLSVGDYLLVATDEYPGRGSGGVGLNQFTDNVVDPSQVGPDLDITYPADYGDNPPPINEELHQITAITPGATDVVITLASPLGKNKLTAWQAYCIKIDPVENFNLRGGVFVGADDHGDESPWEHQYVWTRFMVNSRIEEVEFDTQTARPLQRRRTGQAVRFDTGFGNVMDDLTVGPAGAFDGGEGYGVSFRRGERASVIRNSYLEGCRHAIEFWSSSGGCTAEDNHCHNDTSSAIDTHGNWNTGVIIQRNLVSRDAASAQLSPDLSANEATDAIRVGNNKFMFDENIRVLNNRVINYDGNALSIVPGCWDVVVDGLEATNVWRVLNFKRNSRHTDLHIRDIIVRNVQANDISDRIIDIRHVDHDPNGARRMVARDMLLEDWTIGASGPVGDIANPQPDTEVTGIYLLHVEDLTLRRWTITNMSITEDEWCFSVDEVDGVTFDQVTLDGLPAAQGGETDKGIVFLNAEGISGGITLTNLQNTQSGNDPYLIRFDDGSGRASTTVGTFTLTHDQGPSPRADSPPSGFTLAFAAAP